MRVLNAVFRITFCTAVLFLAAHSAYAQDKQDSSPAAPVTYNGLRQLLRTGQSEEEILILLERSPLDVGFVLGDGQVAELKRMRVSDAFLDGVQQLLKKRTTTLASDVTDLMLILDCSGSMSDRAKDGQSKMEAASKVVRELIRDYPEGRRLGLVVYGHDRSRECQAVDVVRPLSVLDGPGRQQLIQYVADLKPAGHTPIARALEAAAGEMASAKGLSRVVLITDGMESCHGNPVQAAADLVAKTKSTVDVIGFALKPEESQAIDQIARAGRGKFYDAQTAEKLRKDLRFVAQVAPQVEPKAPVDDGKISPAVQALIEQLSDEEANVRHAAAESLGKMGARAKGAVPALMQRLADDLWGSRNNPVNVDNSSGNTSKDSALRALQQLDSGKVEAALVAATKSKNAKTRAWASAQLAPSDTESKSKRPATAVAEPPANGDVPPVVKALIDQLSDEEANVRHAAAESLGKLGSRAKPAAPALMQRLADDLWGSKANPVNFDNSSGNTSKDAALKALKQIAPDKVEPALIEAMRAKNSKTKAWAAAQLGKQ